MRDSNCEDIIRSNWDSLQWSTPMFRLTQKIKAIRVALLQWGNGNARGSIKSIEAKRNFLTSLELECQANPSDQQLFYVHNVTRAKLNEPLAQENSYWHQHSKISWIKDGDHNSKYFLDVVSQRRKEQ